MVLTSQQQDALLLTGWLQLQYGHPDKASVLLAALLQIHPDHQGGRRTLLVALIKQGRGGGVGPCRSADAARGGRRPALALPQPGLPVGRAAG